VSESTRACGTHKACSKCKQVKPLIEFSRRSDTGRYKSHCKPCIADSSRERYRDPVERAKHKALRDRWRAENPTYHAEYYQRNRERMIAAAIEYEKRNPRKRRRNYDPERRREQERARYAADRERYAAVKQAWRDNNAELVAETRRRAMSRRRARLRGLPAERYTLNQLIERDGTLCVLCGEELDLDAVYPDLLAPTVEHLECIVWADSPGDVLSNVAAAHWGCNNRRRTSPHPAAARKRVELLALATAT
jgi:hypothetical protein